MRGDLPPRTSRVDLRDVEDVDLAPKRNVEERRAAMRTRSCRR